MTVLIAGGGIGGLTLALSLHQVGITCRVLESVEEVRPLGVGINLLPHAVRELDELGLTSALAATAVETAELAYFSKRGQAIWREPRGRGAGYAWPQFSIHRGELQMILLNAARERLGPDAILTSSHVLDWQETGEGITAVVERRQGGRAAGIERHAGSLLIAADGIHSTVRAKLHPNEGSPIWNGAILWRGITRGRPFLTGRSMIMAGHEFQKLVCYPISKAALDGDEAVINWIAERKFPVDHTWRREDWNRPGKLEEFLPQFESWQFDWLDAPAMLRAADHVFEYPMVDRDPLERWSHGRLTLLGDAAHPMYPIGSNGASQGILDARVLTRELLHEGLTPAALAAYEAERRPATSRIVLANRGNGPEQVMQMVEQRAPEGYRDIADVLSIAELEEAAAGYKRLAGFDKDQLNARPSIVPKANLRAR